MKVLNVNSLNLTQFCSKDLEQKDALQDAALSQVNNKGSNKKVVTYSLLGLAALGGAIVLINNARRGKVKTPDAGGKAGEAIAETGSKLLANPLPQLSCTFSSPLV